MIEETRTQEKQMKSHIGMILTAFLSAVASGAVFLLALHRQFAMVEVAVSLATGAQVYFLSSSIGDLLENEGAPNRLRFVASLAVLAALLVYFFVTKLLQH
jgi:hypothetical protein